MSLLARLLGAVLTVPLVLSRPILRWQDDRRRRAGEMRLRPPSPLADSGPRLPRASSQAMREMLAEMRRVLDENEAHREVFPHLARFERRFAKMGTRAIREIPVEQLRRALADFEALVRNWSSPPLADLRSRMAVILADRSSAASVWVAVNSVSAERRPQPQSMAERLAARGRGFRASQQVNVDDVSISRFEAAGGRLGFERADRSGVATV